MGCGGNVTSPSRRRRKNEAGGQRWEHVNKAGSGRQTSKTTNRFLKTNRRGGLPGVRRRAEKAQERSVRRKTRLTGGKKKKGDLKKPFFAMKGATSKKGGRGFGIFPKKRGPASKKQGKKGKEAARNAGEVGP